MVTTKQCFASLGKNIGQVSLKEILDDFAAAGTSSSRLDSARTNMRVRMDEKIKSIVSPIAQKHRFDVFHQYKLGHFDLSTQDSSVYFYIGSGLEDVLLALQLNFPPSYHTRVFYPADGGAFKRAEKWLDTLQDFQAGNLEKIFREFVGIKDMAKADLRKRTYTPQQIQNLLEYFDREMARTAPGCRYPDFTCSEYVIGKGFAKFSYSTQTPDGEKANIRVYDPTQHTKEPEKIEIILK